MLCRLLKVQCFQNILPRSSFPEILICLLGWNLWLDWEGFPRSWLHPFLMRSHEETVTLLYSGMFPFTTHSQLLYFQLRHLVGFGLVLGHFQGCLENYVNIWWGPSRKNYMLTLKIVCFWYDLIKSTLLCARDKIETNGTNTILKKFRMEPVSFLSGKGGCPQAWCPEFNSQALSQDCPHDCDN